MTEAWPSLQGRPRNHGKDSVKEAKGEKVLKEAESPRYILTLRSVRNSEKEPNAICQQTMTTSQRIAIQEWADGRKQQSEPSNVHLVLLG